MAKQLRRHCKLSLLFGHLALYVSSSIWVCLNDFSVKKILLETEFGTLTVTWRRSSLLDPSAGRQIFLIEISGWLTKGLALRALSKPVMFQEDSCLFLFLVAARGRCGKVTHTSKSV